MALSKLKAIDDIQIPQFEDYDRSYGFYLGTHYNYSYRVGKYRCVVIPF